MISAWLTYSSSTTDCESNHHSCVSAHRRRCSSNKHANDKIFGTESWHLRWLIFLSCFAELFVNDNVSAAEWFCVNLQRRQATHYKQQLTWVSLGSQSCTRTQLGTHEMTKELWIENLCPQNQLFHLFTSTLSASVLLFDAVCFSDFYRIILLSAVWSHTAACTSTWWTA